MVPLYEPLLNGIQKKYLNESIDSGLVSSEGSLVRRFEERMAAEVGRPHGNDVPSSGRSRKRIGLFLNNDPNEGGAFQYCQTMMDAVAALPEEKYSAFFGYTSDTWLPYLGAFDAPKRKIPLGLWGRALALVWSRLALPVAWWRSICPLFYPVARELLAARCDLWIFPYPSALGYQVPVPALVSVHDLMHRYERRFPESGSLLQYWARERNLNNLGRWARGFLVDSEVGGAQLQACYGISAERIFALPYTAPAYMNVTSPVDDFDRRYRLPVKFIFYPAQFWQHKNHRRLIEAVGLLKRELPDLKLVLAGSPKNACESVKELVEELGLVEDVLFLGYVPDADMPELYRRARALVMPTFYGPTNIPPLEAFVAGCPAAVSAIYAMPEQAGDAALFFDPGSTQQIAGCIRQLWVDDALCAELSEKGRARAKAWGRRQFNERFAAIVEQLLSTSEAPDSLPPVDKIRL